MQPKPDDIFAVLRTCRDPEIPVNVVDLGLVYGVDISPLDADTAEVRVRLTLTSPGCPMAHSIAGEVQRKVQAVPGVGAVHIELVWEPAWHPGLISEEGRRQLQPAF
jgi:metal-sulfur cluster biosynthetic enzyme